MSDVAGAAPAAADSAPVHGAPITEQPLPNAPLGSQAPAQPEPAKPEKAATLDDALDRAIAKNDAKNAEPKPEAKPAPAKDAKPEPKVEPKAEPAKDAKPAPLKDEHGRFVSATPKPAGDLKPAEVKPSHTAEDAPARFTETAKAKWALADPEIRGEVLRMHKELTDGFQKYKGAAEKWDGLKEFDEIATKSGTTVKDALSRYVGMEQKLRADLIGGLDEVVAQATGGKFSLRDIAAHLTGQKPEEVQAQSDATIRELKQTIQRLEQQIGGVVETVKQQREQSTLQEVNKFAADHPRFEELAEDIGLLMKTGRAKDLSEAYALAERLNPAPGKAIEEPPAASSAAIDPPAQPDKGQKSINGAPSPSLSSSPGKKRAGISLDDALDHAFGAVG